jgi:hypothetical protein
MPLQKASLFRRIGDAFSAADVPLANNEVGKATLSV